MSTKPEKNIIVKDDDPAHPTSAVIKMNLLTKSGEPLSIDRLTYVFHPAEDHTKEVNPILEVIDSTLYRDKSMTIKTVVNRYIDNKDQTSIPGKYFVEFKDSKTDLQGFGVEFEIKEIKKDFSFDKEKSTIEIDHPIIYFTDKQEIEKN